LEKFADLKIFTECFRGPHVAGRPLIAAPGLKKTILVQLLVEYKFVCDRL